MKSWYFNTRAHKSQKESKTHYGVVVGSKIVAGKRTGTNFAL